MSLRNDLITTNYLIFLALVIAIPGPFMFFAMTPLVILFQRMTDWRKTAFSFLTWFGIIFLVATVNRYSLVMAYLGIFAMFTLLMGILLWLFLSGKMTVNKLLLSLSIYSLTIIIFLIVAKPLMGIDIIGGLINQMKMTGDSASAIFQKMNMTEKNIQNYLVFQDFAIDLVRNAYAALVFIFVLTSVFLNAFLARLFLHRQIIPDEKAVSPVLKKTKGRANKNRNIPKPVPLFKPIEQPAKGSLESLQLDFSLTWFFIVSWAGLLIASMTGHLLLKNIFMNAFLICGAFYALQGVMVFTSFFSRLRANIVVKIALLVLISLILPPFMFLLGIFGLGLFDAWFNIRKLKSDGG